MSFLSSLLDPAGTFSGNAGDAFNGIFDPGGSFLDSIGLMPSFYSDAADGVSNTVDSMSDFEMNQLGDWWNKTKNNPLQLAVGAGDPFSTKAWNGVLGQDWTPYVNQQGGPTPQAYQSAEANGIDTGPSKAGHTVASLVSSYYGGQALGGLFGQAGNAAGIGTTGGQTVGGGVVGAGNAWANDQNVGEGFIKGALPGATKGLTNSMNTSDYFGSIDNPIFKGLAQGAVQGAISNPNNMGQGAVAGGVAGGLGSFISDQGYGTPGGNTALLNAGLGAYLGSKANNEINSQIGGIKDLFSPNSAYAQQLRQQLERKDAAAGRRSQYGGREVELQAALAKMAAGQAPTLQSLYNQKNQNRNLMYANLLKQSGPGLSSLFRNSAAPTFQTSPWQGNEFGDNSGFDLTGGGA